MCAASGSAQTTLELTVPEVVAERAAARAAGDARAPTPVLMLEGVELAADEGLTIRVLGPRPDGDEPPPVLAVIGAVGTSAPSQEPPQPVTLAVPLNDRASRLLAGRREITLTLEVEGDPERPPLRVERAYFDTGDDPSD